MKALETKYHNITFRSRTEARWAVFFDELRLPYAYEPEGFDLGGDWYLPDFWLPTPGLWFEVKGVQPDAREVRVAKALSKASRCPVIIAVGPPPTSDEYNLRVFEAGEERAEAAFCHWGDFRAIVSPCQTVSYIIRGSHADCGGMPEVMTGPARVAAANRFGVHE